MFAFAFTAATSGGVAIAGVPFDPGLLAYRTTQTLHGNFVVIGNTGGQSLEAGVDVPIVGTVGAGGANTADTAPDLFWRSDDPIAGQASANSAFTAANARSTAVLALPPDATVVYARLIWGAEQPGAGDSSVTVTRTGGGAFSQVVNASSVVLSASDKYGSSADVTALVQTNGAGAYRVEGIDCVPLTNRNDADVFIGWSLIVIYERAADPRREITLIDGMQLCTAPLGIQFTRLLPAPVTGTQARLAIVAHDGDSATTGDGVSVNGSPISNLFNPVNNIFNSTRTTLGVLATSAGDLPQETGGPNSMSGLDIDVFDVAAGVTSIPPTPVMVNITPGADFVWISAMVFATEVIDCTAPAIVTPPANAMHCPTASQSATYSVSASGTAPLAYEWQVETSPGVYQTITGAATPMPCGGLISATAPTAATTTINITKCPGQFSYSIRAFVSNPCGTVNSAPALLQICTLDGDANCDGAVNNFDIDAFVQAILNPAGYAATYPNCNPLNCDTNNDDAVNNFDIDSFVGCILNTGCP